MPHPQAERPAVTLFRALPPHSATMRGIALMIASTLAFSTMHVMVRHVSADLHPLQVAFFRNIFGLLVFLPVILRHGFGFLRTSRLPMHGLRSVLNVVAMLCFFYALTIAPLTRVTALAFTTPLFVAVLGFVFLGERFRLRRWSAIIIGFAGTLVILRPGLIPADLGSILVLTSAGFWGMTMIVIKLLSRTDSSLTITGYSSILLSVLSLGPALYVWTQPTLEQLALLMLMGIVGTLAQIAFAQSLKDADTTAVLPFDFLKLVWASMFGVWLFGEVPDTLTWIGAVIVFASSFYIAWREHQAGKAGRDNP